MLHHRGFLGNLAVVVIQDCFCLNQYNVNFHAHLVSLLVANHHQLGFNKSVERHCKEFPTLILNPKMDDLCHIEMVLFIFDVLDDKGMSTSALELAGEFKEVLELFGFILVMITGTRTS